jgi:lipoate-protein ligase A
MVPSPAMSTGTWRYVDCGAVDAFQNNAQMAVLSRSTAEGGRPILQTSVWGRTHLNVGWFDDVDSTLDLAACERLGMQVIRRPFAGGGTAYYAAGCALMWGLMKPKPVEGSPVSLDDEIAAMQPVVLDALGRIGLGEVEF